MDLESPGSGAPEGRRQARTPHLHPALIVASLTQQVPPHGQSQTRGGRQLTNKPDSLAAGTGAAGTREKRRQGHCRTTNRTHYARERRARERGRDRGTAGQHTGLTDHWHATEAETGSLQDNTPDSGRPGNDGQNASRTIGTSGIPS